MTDFTREQLEAVVDGDLYVRMGSSQPDDAYTKREKRLAAFALALLDQKEKAEALVKKWEKEIGAVMPSDLKDWHENAIEEHPEVARWMIENGKEDAEWAWQVCDQNVEAAKKAEAERDSFRLEADRLREELREAEAREPHYLRDSRLRAEGMRLAAEIARNLRPKEACTCGNYLSFRNGVPEHLPGCLVGECIDVADEIEGRAEEIDRSNNE